MNRSTTFLDIRRFFKPLVLALSLAVAPGTPAQPGGTQRFVKAEAIPNGLSASDWSSIRQHYERHRHAALPMRGGYQARNPGQQWQTRFDGRGFTTRPEVGSWQWGLELRSYGFPGHEQAVVGQPPMIATGGRVAYDWDATLQEWFLNDTHGLEHGFTLHTQPAGAGDKLRVNLTVRGNLSPELQADGRGLRFVDAHGATMLTYADLAVRDADGRILPARFEAAVEGVCLAVEEHGARYPLTIDPLAQQAYLKASNPDPSDEFGLTVAVSGDTVVVGAPFEASAVATDPIDNHCPSAGAAYVFVRDPSSHLWSFQAYLKASNTPTAADPLAVIFGYSVAISGDTIVVGSPWESEAAVGAVSAPAPQPMPFANLYVAPGSGAAYVFVRDGTTWTQQAYLKASNSDDVAQFGQSVAISGDTVAVGANQEANHFTGVINDPSGIHPTAADCNIDADNSGAAYVFVRDPSSQTWKQQAYLKASNNRLTVSGNGDNDGFGGSVSVSGNTVVVGASQESSLATGVLNSPNNPMPANNQGADASGAAYVFVRDTGTQLWSQQAYLKASNTGQEDVFGSSVSVSGDTVVVGAPQEDNNVNTVINDPVGSLIVDPTTANSNHDADTSGAAYVFVRTGTTWAQQAYLKASNTGPGLGSSFGYSVAVSGATVVVGAILEGSDATGVINTPPDPAPLPGGNTGAPEAGAAYVFSRDTGTQLWSQTAYLKASNTGTEDLLGYFVAIDGTTVVVGATGEANDLPTVINDPFGIVPVEPTALDSDNNDQDAGAAYVFEIHTTCCSGQNLIVNGSFEDTSPAVGVNAANDSLDPNTGVPGWWTTGSFLEVWGNTFGGIPAAGGANQLEINAQSDNQTVSQTVTGLSTNCSVAFCFNYTGRFGVVSNTPNNDFTVTLSDGVTTYFSVPLDPTAYAVGGWLSFCTNFIATTPAITVAFHGQPHFTDGTQAYQGGAHIDNVSLTQCCCPPRPALNYNLSGNLLVLSWSSECYHLQATDLLSPSTLWQNVAGSSPVSLLISGHPRFFRLVCP